MSHPRATIRQAVLNLLAAPEEGVYPTAAQARVYTARVQDLASSDLPAILIHTPIEETVQPVMSATNNTLRRVDVVVTAVTAATELDDAMDDLAEEVETAIYSVSLLGLPALVERVDYISMASVMSDEAGFENGRITLTFSVTYSVRQPEPGQATEVELLEINNQFDIAPHGESFEMDHAAVAELEEEV